MSDLKLSYARKYRPATLTEYIGNEKLKKSAMSRLSEDIKPQVILLEGASGCGKTTFARLLAKEYSCSNRDEEKGACGECIYCQQIDEYIHTGVTDMLENIREIDIADNSGKRDLDSVFEEMSLPVFGNQWRVYIFDECHMASDGAQNRMLKVAEEPPENVLMIFCTTDPDRMLETLRNRCQVKLHVSKPEIEDLAKLLERVCRVEGVEYDIKGLKHIARRSNLTIREALASLEQVVSEQGNASYDSVVQVFEEVSDTVMINFYKKLMGTPEYDTSGNVVRDELGNARYKRDVWGYVTLLHQIKVKSGFKQFVNSLRDFTIRGIYCINNVGLDDVSEGEFKIYRDLFGNFTVEQLACIINKISLLLDKSQNVEVILLQLGYTGLIDYKTDKQVSKPVFDTGIESIDGELGKERQEGDTNRVQSREALEKQGIANADIASESCSFDDIQSLFGSATVLDSCF